MKAVVKETAPAFSMEERWSMLADGELEDEALSQLLTQWEHDEAEGEGWHIYQVIGDVLRSSDLAQAHVTLSSVDFMQNFRQRLRQEPAIVAPAPLNKAAKSSRLHWPHWVGWIAASGFVMMAIVAVVYTTDNPAANDHPVVAAVGTDAPLREDSQVATAAATGGVQPVSVSALQPAHEWQSVSEQMRMATGMRLASQPGVTLVSTPQGRVWRDQRLEPYLSAHQQFGNNLFMGMPAGNVLMNNSVPITGNVRH